ncbi:MAG: hypothetical protein U0Y10_15425 [Spirosomataceae bacterium]
MSVNSSTIGLVSIGDVGQEPMALRGALEYMGFRIVYYPIGRPSDFVAVLNGKALYPDIQTLILSSHGHRGAIVMPQLDPSLYLAGEPQGDFDNDLIQTYGHLPLFTVLATGCGLSTLASGFQQIGCSHYLSATDYVEGNASLLFVVLFFYERSKGSSVEQAFQKASSLDSETQLFQLFSA